MAWMPSNREFLDNTAARQRDHQLIDRLTVTCGYADLVEMYPGNTVYKNKFQQSLIELASAIDTIERTFSNGNSGSKRFPLGLQ